MCHRRLYRYRIALGKQSGHEGQKLVVKPFALAVPPLEPQAAQLVKLKRKDV